MLLFVRSFAGREVSWFLCKSRVCREDLELTS